MRIFTKSTAIWERETRREEKLILLFVHLYCCYSWFVSWPASYCLSPSLILSFSLCLCVCVSKFVQSFGQNEARALQTKRKIAENCSIFVQTKRAIVIESERQGIFWRGKTHAKNNPIKKHICSLLFSTNFWEYVDRKCVMCVCVRMSVLFLLNKFVLLPFGCCTLFLSLLLLRSFFHPFFKNG